MKRLGIDIGSTTIKCTVLDEEGLILWSTYERHQSKINLKLSELLSRIRAQFPEDEEMITAFSGSAGMGVAEALKVPFVQEVFATRLAVEKKEKDTDVVIELGGEDAKILFLTGAVEVRMNGTCAGGTGSFIDQMAQLMGVTPNVMNDMAKDSKRRYTIASRCGVFAKSDIQPLLNQGARKEDISSSIYYAVVNQTIAGLSQSREIKGNILYLGGPLTFSSYLRQAFDDVLKTKGRCPENSLLFVSYGAAISRDAEKQNLALLEEMSRRTSSLKGASFLPPLFKDRAEYEEFLWRHEKDSKGINITKEPKGKLYLGIDAGSTTLKTVIVDENGDLFRPMYVSNKGNPVPLVKEYLESFYSDCPDLKISGAAVTGYGEDIIKAAFGVDYGVVETIAHFTAAKHFSPDVDFIIDIGGQDIKCFRIRRGTIDSIFLNEACSSGCGSFLETFAKLLGYSIEDFSKIALHSMHPVDLGSRCTVFMNSSVKEAQKNGAEIEDISAGLSISVVRNALYKVIRTPDPSKLGEHIVVQGGTFLNDAVLRAFEKETGKEVLRPKVAGLMGAYGAALWARKKSLENGRSESSLIDSLGLKTFVHSAKNINCNGCNNHCHLTMNDFGRGEKFIAGNRCDKPLGKKSRSEGLDEYRWKRERLSSFGHKEGTNGKTIGLPMALGMWELLPFWHTLFSNLGFGIEISSPSSHDLYTLGQQTIVSDTACYPAKLMHGHIEDLKRKNVDYIFAPSLTYNIDEKKGDNHYNCPVVAYYPEVIRCNVKMNDGTRFLSPFLNISNEKTFSKYFTIQMNKEGIDLDERDVKRAAGLAYKALAEYKSDVEKEGERIIEKAEKENIPLVVLVGRPYHVDSEINHGIDTLLTSLGVAIITEDSVSRKEEKFRTMVLNQWTYHSRLYGAAKWVRDRKDNRTVLIHLVSFGCGVDAITGDETRAIIESGEGIYTQIKIDEISNLGAVKIRIRSLLAVKGLE